MRLNPRPYAQMRSGEKTIEIRLNDAKRRTVAMGDTILFHPVCGGGPPLRVRVLALYPFATFRALYEAFPFQEFGCGGLTMEQMLEGTYRTYTPEREAQWGALGIRVRVLPPGEE